MPVTERDMQIASATFVKRCLELDPTRINSAVHTFNNTSISGVPLGSWRITVEPLRD